MRFRRLASTALSVVMISSSVYMTGCGNKPQRDVPEVTEDMPWYESSVASIDPVLDPAEYLSAGVTLIGRAGGYVVFESFGQQPFSVYEVYTPDKLDMRFLVYDLDGGFCYDTDPKEIVRGEAPDAVEIGIRNVVTVGDDLVITAAYTAGDEFKEQDLTYDVETQEVISVSDVISDPGSERRFTLGLAEADGYSLEHYEKLNDDGAEYHVKYSTPDGETKDICISDGMPMEELVLAYDLLYLGDLVFAIKYENYEHENIYCIVDLADETVKEAGTTDEYSWLYDLKNAWNYKYYAGIGNALISQEGIKLLDVEEHEETIYISFDDCDINRFDVSSLELLDLQEDKVTLAGVVYRNETSELIVDYDAQIVVLQRCDTNPNVGKKILTAASLDGLSYPMAEAIRLYNLNNEEAMIIMDPKYSYNAVAQDIIFDAGMDEYTYDLQVKAAFMNILSIDLLANEGPDIILGTMEYDQLNNPDMMLDLSDAANADGVYENVMGFAMTGDKLYQVPVAVELEGIMVDKDNVDATAPGFSYETYLEYMSGPCNGADPCRMTKVEYLCAVLAESGYTFRNEDGSYDYDNEDFAAAAAFVESLDLRTDAEIEEEDLSLSWLSGDRTDHVNINTALEFLFQTHNLVDENLIMGFPSSEPRGVLMNVKQSVGVCAATGAPEACKDFVRMLLGEDVQTLFGKYCGISVNSEAQATACRWFTERINEYYRTISDIHDYQEREALEEPQEEADPERVVEVMDGYIRNAAGFRHSDAAIEIIIREEIQAYFAGQKTIEEVMDLIQNRVDLYVEERG